MMARFLKTLEMLLEKEKLLVTSNFSFSHRVFERLVPETRKNKGLFVEGVYEYQLSSAKAFVMI